MPFSLISRAKGSNYHHENNYVFSLFSATVMPSSRRFLKGKITQVGKITRLARIAFRLWKAR